MPSGQLEENKKHSSILWGLAVADHQIAVGFRIEMPIQFM